MYTAFVVKLWVSKGSEACQILTIITFVCLLFTSFSSLEKRFKSLRLEVTFIKILCWSALLFCWRILPFLLLPGRTCRTWTILWTERLLSKSGHGMATPELMEVDNDDNVVVIINCVALYYEKGASGNGFPPKEKFRAPVSRQVKTLKVLKETVRWVDLSLRAQENSKEVWVPTTSLHL